MSILKDYVVHIIQRTRLLAGQCYQIRDLATIPGNTQKVERKHKLKCFYSKRMKTIAIFNTLKGTFHRLHLFA